MTGRTTSLSILRTRKLPWFVHAIIAWLDFAEHECLLFVFGQRRVADTAHYATNTRRVENLSADDLANLLSIFFLTNQRVNVWDGGDSFALHFKQRRCDGIDGETLKLLA
jgi:hypothetical protein